MSLENVRDRGYCIDEIRHETHAISGDTAVAASGTSILCATAGDMQKAVGLKPLVQAAFRKMLV